MIELIDKDLKMEDLLKWLKCLHNFIGTNESFERMGLWDFQQPLEEVINIVEQLYKGEWISVKDGLPKENENVLVYAIGKLDNFKGQSKIEITDYGERSLFPKNVSYKGWRNPYGYFLTDFEITHWMPLPEPPKEE